MSKEMKKAYRAVCSMEGFVSMGAPMDVIKETAKCYLCAFSGDDPRYRIKKEDIGHVRYVGENALWPRLVTEVISDDRMEAEMAARDLFAEWFRDAVKAAGGIRAVNIDWDADGHEDELPKEILVPGHILMGGIEEVSNFLSEETGFCHRDFRLVGLDTCWDRCEP